MDYGYLRLVSIIKNLDMFRPKRFLVENEFVALPQKRHFAALGS
jgi:hypothetical protein